MLFINQFAVSQKSFNYRIFIDSLESTHIFTNVRDSLILLEKINRWVTLQREDGYFLAGIDSLVNSNQFISIYLHQGKKFRYVAVIQDSLSFENILSLNLQASQSKYATPDLWSEQFKNWITTSAQQGYPFARVDILPIKIKSDSLLAYYRFQKGDKVYFHQTDQRQKKVLEHNVLNRLTGIYPAELYNQKLVEEIETKLNRVTYINLRAEPRVLFLGNEGIVWLYLEKSKASKFDILLGLSPETGLSNKKFKLTGEAGFELINTLKIGERIYLKYENLIDNSPKLKLGFDFPFVKYMPFGLAADFHLFRFGEQYIDISTQLLVSYPWSSLQYSGISFSYLSSTILNPDTTSLIRTMRLPSQLDYNYYALGLRHQFNNLDYTPNPSRGFHLLLDVKAGKKMFNANSVLLSYDSDQFNVTQQYDSLNQIQDLAIYSMNLAWYTSLKSRHVLKFSLLTRGLLGSAKILDNELIRIGGYKNLRGFDEDFLKCKQAFIQTIEYRFLLDRNSFINVFSDFAYLNQSLSDDIVWNWYEGIGFGIQFQTKIGAFALQYALGANKQESIDIGKGKVHFGYNTLF